ncbi:beta-lactamase/transpeptidase-like protein [Aspergillus indologenus CBS 114.80]|uniref:Beta-lactamase/transpeptidase-like protein n=1 Tax=Aspergillus indologenus CBS 114.80 TaxID=1450541 RepID=A0A2V5HNI3_9EURO|nr:beta-lactamase/transpeptidase-like protein [Aspergillus indologenus CBS 114.80]
MGPAPDNDSTPLDGDFEREVYEALKLWKIPGIAIAVVDGESTWTEGYGIADLASSTKVEANTLFYGGSTTKAFTAALMSMLVEDNGRYPHVQWSTPVCELIRDDFVLDHPGRTADTTIEDILSHRTGLPGHDFSMGSVHAGQQATVQDVVRSLRFLPAAAPPRTTYIYNNAMYIVASHLIQTVTGEELRSLFQRSIWDPLGMSHTYLRLEDALAGQEPLAKGYADESATDDDPQYEEVPWKARPEISGAGAIISSVGDYAKWVHALMNPETSSSSSSSSGDSTATTSLSAAVCADVGTARTLIPPPSDPFLRPMAYCLGWNRYVYRGVEILTHDGGIDGFGAEIAMIPALKYAVVTMANSTYTANFGGTCLVYKLIDDKLGIAAEDRYDWTQKYMDAYNANAVSYFYPTLPDPPRPGPTLPLAAYAGLYWHDGYGALELVLDAADGKLHATRTQAQYTTACALTFEHVSGDFFTATVAVVGAQTVVPAEFALSPAGVPRAIGIGWEPHLGTEKRTWMRRVGADEAGRLLRGDQPHPHPHHAEAYVSYQRAEAQLPEFLTSQLFV